MTQYYVKNLWVSVKNKNFLSFNFINEFSFGGLFIQKNFFSSFSLFQFQPIIEDYPLGKSEPCNMKSMASKLGLSSNLWTQNFVFYSVEGGNLVNADNFKIFLSTSASFIVNRATTQSYLTRCSNFCSFILILCCHLPGYIGLSCKHIKGIFYLQNLTSFSFRLLSVFLHSNF